MNNALMQSIKSKCSETDKLAFQLLKFHSQGNVHNKCHKNHKFRIQEGNKKVHTQVKVQFSRLYIKELSKSQSQIYEEYSFTILSFKKIFL